MNQFAYFAAYFIVMQFSSLAVFCGSKAGADPIFLQHAKELGYLLAEKNIKLIYGGGGKGIMGAVADAGGRRAAGAGRRAGRAWGSGRYQLPQRRAGVASSGRRRDKGPDRALGRGLSDRVAPLAAVSVGQNTAFSPRPTRRHRAPC